VTSSVRSPRDFWTGILYAAIGLGAVLLGRGYGRGSALRMGPGYFPTLLGGLLAFIGVVCIVRSFVRKGEPIGAFGLKGLFLVLGATMATGFLVRGAGIAVALPVLVLASAYASAKFRWGPALALAAGITLFCAMVFIKGLGIPLPILGPWLGG
jgi:putative tricarboxylic transport membrane protein